MCRGRQRCHGPLIDSCYWFEWKIYFICFRIGFDIAWISRTAKTSYSSNGQWSDGHHNSIGSITRKCKIYRIQTVKDICWTRYNDERKWKKSIFVWQVWFSLRLEMASRLLKEELNIFNCLKKFSLNVISPQYIFKYLMLIRIWKADQYFSHLRIWDSDVGNRIKSWEKSLTSSNGCHHNGSASKNPDIKAPLVVSFSLGVVIHFSPLAFWCQGSSKDSH